MAWKRIGTENKSLIRLRLFSGMVVFLFLLIASRLYFVQVIKAEEYRAVAEDQQGLVAKLLPARGEIKVFDKYSPTPVPVATNIKKPLVYVVPSQLEDANQTAGLLAKVLDMEESALLSKLTLRKRSYVPLKKDLSEVEVKRIKELGISGVEFDFEISRFYPEQSLLAHVLGFVGFRQDSGTSKLGIYGLEKQYEKELAGKVGSLKSTKDAKGTWLLGPDQNFESSKDGVQLILTIDRTLQLNAEKVLSSTVATHQADGGCILVINPKTGAVLAMASNPIFNPNEYNKVTEERAFQNLCTTGSYEPGSVFKPITMAAALDAGTVTPDTSYEDTGEVEIASYTIKNSDNKANGKQNMIQVLEKSLNTGMIFVQRSLGNLKFKQYVEKFGFGKPSGIDLLEDKGALRNLEGNIEVNYATASFGQGISVTPIQLVKAYSALANKGSMSTPYIVQTVVQPTGESSDRAKEEAVEVISAKTSSTIGAMLVSVVEHGHGKKAGVPGYYIAGKTGTAQVARKDGRGYDPNNNIGTFIGYGPVEDPQFVMLVRVDHPRTVQFAENTAAPAFGELARFILSYFNTVPTRTAKGVQ